MKYWIKEHGICTPGGDPYWICPECGGGGHCYGIERVDGPYDHCRDCGIELHYPWEKKNEK